MSEQLIEIWSNKEGTEFAITVSGMPFKARTNQNARYELIVDKIPYFSDLDYQNWNFTLERWLMHRKTSKNLPRPIRSKTPSNR